MQTKLDRLNIVVRYLKGEGIIKNQQDIVEAMGSNKTTISLVFKGNEKYLTDNFLIKFNKAFNNLFSTDWLISGLGDIRAGQEDPNLDAEIDAVVQKMVSEGQSIGGSVPYEFVQQLFRERETHDQIMLSQQKTIDRLTELLQENKKTSSVPGKDVTCAAVSGSDITR